MFLSGAVLFIKKLDASTNSLTLQPQSGLIDGAASFSLAQPWAAAALIASGGNYYSLYGSPTGSVYLSGTEGIANYVPKFASTSKIIPSNVFDNGSLVTFKNADTLNEKHSLATGHAWPSGALNSPGTYTRLSNAGTDGVFTVSGSDEGGVIRFVVGNSPTPNTAIVTVNFSGTFPNAPAVVITPRDQTTAQALNFSSIMWASSSTTGWTWFAGTVGASGSVFNVNWIAKGCS